MDGIVAIVLLPAHERLHILWADDLHLVTQCLELAGPEECARAGLDHHDARIDLRQDGDPLITHHPSLQDDVSIAIDAMQLEYGLGDINAECLDGHSGSPLVAGTPACRVGGRAVHPISWRKEYGGLQLEQAKRLKELERENSRLRRLVADLSLEKQVLKDVAQGTAQQLRSPTCKPRATAAGGRRHPREVWSLGASRLPHHQPAPRDAAIHRHRSS